MTKKQEEQQQQSENDYWRKRLRDLERKKQPNENSSDN
jgi:hypothetical protein